MGTVERINHKPDRQLVNVDSGLGILLSLEGQGRSDHGRKGKINWGKKEGQVITEGQGAAQGTKEKTDPIS